LRPGGYLITTCDPYRADDKGEDLELQVFNRHPDVLLGVNERIPRLAEFVEAIERQRNCIVPALFTHATYNAVVDGRRRKFISEMRQWDYEADLGMLRRTSGSLAMRIRLGAPIASAPRLQPTWAIRVADIAEWMTSQSEAMAKLSVFAPESAVNAPFPVTRSDRLQLLNGWLSPTRARWRQAYCRARWYLRRRDDQTRMSFEVHSELGGPFSILLNGEVSVQVSLHPATWKSILVDLSEAPVDQAFVMEMRLDREPRGFSDGLFSVRRRRIGEPGTTRWIRAARAILPAPAASS
jgi:hypothetical protein